MITIKDLIEMSPSIPKIYLVDAIHDVCAIDLIWEKGENCIVVNYDFNGTISFITKIIDEDDCRGFFKQKDDENKEKIIDFFKETFNKFSNRVNYDFFRSKAAEESAKIAIKKGEEKKV